jgi:NADPH:quinone reductase-like Zn-dependent oxidoreductase
MATQQIPDEMRAAAFDQFGRPEVVHTETVPVPKLGKNDVLVHVATAGIGPWDPHLVNGDFHDVDPVRFPRVGGSDGAGTIAAVGDNVDDFSVGDRVYGWGFGNPKGGFLAEYAAIPARDVALIPGQLSDDEAGALAVAGITALQGLEHLWCDPGDAIMIFGASGGVGHIALQLAKILGLRVFAIASRDDGVELVERLGADAAGEGRDRSLRRMLREFAPDGYAGALVFTGARGWKRELELVERGGVIAYPNGVEPAPKVPRGRKRIAYDGEGSPDAFARLNELVEQGPFDIELSHRYALDETAQALRDVQHHHVGKLIIRID